MRRDMELLRTLLLQLEEMPAGEYTFYPAVEASGAVVQEHLRLLIDEGLVEGEIVRALGGEWAATQMRITSRGHDVIAAIRDKENLRKFLDWAGKTGKAITIDLLLWWIKSQLGGE